MLEALRELLQMLKMVQVFYDLFSISIATVSPLKHAVFACRYSTPECVNSCIIAQEIIMHDNVM